MTLEHLKLSQKLLSVCESPIEIELATALIAESALNEISVQLCGMSAGPEGIVLTIEPQVVFGKYRADFLIMLSPWPGTRSYVVVECDGHEFHERTKEQAKRDRERDRYMTSAGHPFLRFTGSEIHKEPMVCANEITRFLANSVAAEIEKIELKA